MVDRKRVLLVLPSLVGGGAEKLAVLLLEHLDRERFQPLLTLFEDRCDYSVPEDVPITCLNKKRRSNLPRLIWRLARIYEKDKPDVVLGFMNYANLIAVLARKLSRTKRRLLLSEVNNASINLRQMPGFRPLMWAITRLYPQSDGVICISNGVADDLVANFRIPREKIKVIYGMVDIDHILALAEEDVDHPWFAPKERPVIVILARLVARKGHPYLLKAFAQVTAKCPSRLVILGEGEERGALEDLAKHLGVEKDVAFLGFQENPFKYIAQSDIFVLSSMWAGFELVIIEAMACGVPIVSTRCPSGPEEIITDGVNGLLVTVADEGALAESMLRLLNDKEFATKLAQAGRKRARDFAVEKITREYERQFSAVMGNPTCP